ncbi:PAS domain-containing sensor histidine kinase [Roseococcus suduntuyensis]|uniref:histidine kinase n=2 Tax=Roseococcus suduntuyensis TaxID=455361 RepID=A0A840A7U5_9PROT|nr:PAS domain-containing sensor histidine kinase [Roseococcus suduntuyensis]MBB3897281.1 PAS domain S-box-containing protein [Roseococcus suduntuyensis]
MNSGPDAHPTAADLLLEMELAPGEGAATALVDALREAAAQAGFSLDLAALQAAIEAQGPIQLVLARAQDRLLLLTIQPGREGRLALATWLPTTGRRVDLDIQLLQAVMDQLPAAVSIKDSERRYRFVNRCWEASLSLRRAEVLGRRFEDLEGTCLSPKTFARLAEELRRDEEALIEGRATETESEQAFTSPHRGPRTMLVSKVPLRGLHDPRPGVLSVTVEITERKRAEQDLRAATAQLSERSAALSAARDRAERARRDAEAAARTKARFLAMMSHELRTPMTGVLGMLDLMEDGGDGTEARDRLQALRGSAEALMRVLDDILDYSLIESGHFELRDAPFDPAALLREVAEQFAALAARQGLFLHVEVAPDLPAQVLGDAQRLRQVLGHLLSNGVKFTQEGGITVRMGTEAGPDGAPLLVLNVLDTGPGIPPERRAELFQPYTPLEEVTSRRAGGTGLGLVICRQLAHAMRGEVACEDAPGGGALFRFSLPLRLPAPPRVAPRPTPARVLVVDDVALNRKVVSAILERDGHQVVLAATGEEAVARVAEGPRFDLVLMDLHMPGMDGIAATAAIRALPGEAGRVPVHALTADVFARTSPEYAMAGFTGFLTKPLDWAAIRQAIAAAPAGEATTEAAPAADGAPVLDRAQLAGMFEGLPRDAVDQMYQEFLRSLHDALARLRAQRDRDDGAALAREAHSLKGLAGNFGAARLAEAAATLQSRLDSGSVVASLPMASLEAAYSDTAEAIQAGTHLHLLDAAFPPPRPH